MLFLPVPLLGLILYKDINLKKDRSRPTKALPLPTFAPATQDPPNENIKFARDRSASESRIPVAFLGSLLHTTNHSITVHFAVGYSIYCPIYCETKTQTKFSGPRSSNSLVMEGLSSPCDINFPHPCLASLPISRDTKMVGNPKEARRYHVCRFERNDTVSCNACTTFSFPVRIKSRPAHYRVLVLLILLSSATSLLNFVAGIYIYKALKSMVADGTHPYPFISRVGSLSGSGLGCYIPMQSQVSESADNFLPIADVRPASCFCYSAMGKFCEEDVGELDEKRERGRKKSGCKVVRTGASGLVGWIQFDEQGVNGPTHPHHRFGFSRDCSSSGFETRRRRLPLKFASAASCSNRYGTGVRTSTSVSSYVAGDTSQSTQIERGESATTGDGSQRRRLDAWGGVQQFFVVPFGCDSELVPSTYASSSSSSAPSALSFGTAEMSGGLWIGCTQAAAAEKKRGN
ncbi:hypothetical protein K438DRAFT_1942454 [Mycena galopus ATCC 62051]|nr:hypothetical protein K438DRAFT_1942454 [Mycena galopus ATCC 62051]